MSGHAALAPIAVAPAFLAGTSMAPARSVMVADAQPLLREGIAALLDDAGFDVRACCGDGEEALEAIRALRPAIAILDIAMPLVTGLEVLQAVRREARSTRVVLLVPAIDRAQIMAAAALVTDGLVLKGGGSRALLLCLERVLAGEQWLDRDAMREIVATLSIPAARVPAGTPRETEIAGLVALGKRNKEIARALGLSEGTVKMHLHNLYEKLDVSSRTELAMMVRDGRLASGGTSTIER